MLIFDGSSSAQLYVSTLAVVAMSENNPPQNVIRDLGIGYSVYMPGAAHYHWKIFSPCLDFINEQAVYTYRISVKGLHFYNEQFIEMFIPLMSHVKVHQQMDFRQLQRFS